MTHQSTSGRDRRLSTLRCRRATRKRPSCTQLRRPSIEPLEDRRLLSAGPTGWATPSAEAAARLEPGITTPGTVSAKTAEPGVSGDWVPDLIVAEDGLTVDTDGHSIRDFVLSSEARIFTGEPVNYLDLRGMHQDYHIYVPAMGFSGTHLLGDVIGDEFDGTDLFEDLSYTYTDYDTGSVHYGTLIPISAESGQIRGSVFRDLNADGVRDADEPGLPQWTVYVDLDNDGQLGAQEPLARTGGEGQYTLWNVAAGTYAVAQVVPDTWEQTLPGGGASQTVTLTAGQLVTAVDFGTRSTLAEIHGSKWDDADGDGTWDPGEPGLADWTIYLDLDNDGRPGADEPSTVTDTDGRYVLDRLDAGSYTVAEVVQDDWGQTFPGGTGRHTVALTAGEIVTDVDFGNRRTNGVFGGVWCDLDENGLWDDGEPGVADWTIYVDLDLNGQFDWGEPSTLTRHNGQYVFTGLDPGTYTVAGVVRSGWEQTFPAGDGAHVVTLEPGGAAADVDFGNAWRSDFGSGGPGDGVVDLIVTGSGITISSDGSALNGYLIRSSQGIFTGEPADNLGVFRTDDDYWIAGQMGYVLDGTHFLGYVVGTEFAHVDLAEDLVFTHTLDDRPGTFDADILSPSHSAIDVKLATVASPTAWDEAAALPQSLGQVPWGDSFFVEVWVQDASTQATGIKGGYVDLSFTTAQLDVLAVEHGGLFTEMPGGRIDETGGVVGDLGGGTSGGGIGVAPNWARLGYVECRAAQAGEAAFSLDSGSIPVVRDGAGHVPWNDVQSTGATPKVPIPAQVVGRRVFYNGSAFDGGDPAAGPEDDDAIAPDKTALLPGQSASFANYTSFSRGINGVMVDVQGLPAGSTLQAGDFRFRIGNDDHPDQWADAPDPVLVETRRGAGSRGSDRVTVVWADNATGNGWLQVTLLSNARTSLAQDEVFYFGNAIGESGNSATDAKVGAVDMLAARDNPRNFKSPAPIDFDFDYDRDRRVGAVDMLIARDNYTHFLNALKLITAPAAGDGLKGQHVGESGRPAAGQVSHKLAWLCEFEPADGARQTSSAERPRSEPAPGIYHLDVR